jgi:hypothetical protein
MDDVLRFLLDAWGSISFFVLGIIILAAVLLFFLFVMFNEWTGADKFVRVFFSLFPVVFGTAWGKSVGDEVGGLLGAVVGSVYLWFVWFKVPPDARGIVIMISLFLTLAWVGLSIEMFR